MKLSCLGRVNLRVETVHNELRAKESKHDGIGRWRDCHAGGKNRPQTHISQNPLGLLGFSFFVE